MEGFVDDLIVCQITSKHKSDPLALPLHNTDFISGSLPLNSYIRPNKIFTAEKQWETVAYIDRAEAWAVYEPRFTQFVDSFTALYTAAENETDLFKKALRLSAAEQYARRADFEAADSFGQILYPARMNAVFSGVRSNSASLSEKIETARRNAAVFIDCPADFESLIVGAFSRAITACGFPVTRTRITAAAVCTITVDEGKQQRDLGIFYFPSLQAVLTGASGTLFTYNASAERASAVTEDVAKRRAYTALAEAVQKSFVTEFRRITVRMNSEK